MSVVKNVLVYSPEGEIILFSSYESSDFPEDRFDQLQDKIKHTAQQLVQGSAQFTFDNFKILITKNIYPVALLFHKEKDITQAWINAAKKIGNKIASIAKEFEKQTNEDFIVKELRFKEKIREFEETFPEIFHDAEHTPTKKLKESIW
ncbi:MAG: hypothetical protein U9O98_01670 [Asgard group archaeon]|nr:hypothetical protein [Asgard group archaeon]